MTKDRFERESTYMSVTCYMAREPSQEIEELDKLHVFSAILVLERSESGSCGENYDRSKGVL